MEIRVKAMKWWNDLTLKEKSTVYFKYNSLIVAGSERSYLTLTGREIETIYISYNRHNKQENK